jgi:hypothetical protein
MRQLNDMNLLQVIDIINKYEKKIYKILREDKTYDKKQLRSYHKDLKDLSSELKGFIIITKESLSRRRALIVILQEYFFKDIEYPKDIILEFYENKANSRFIIENRNKADFKTPQEAHPKKPREYYEDQNLKMHHYIKSLELLCILPNSYFEKEEAIESIIKLYHDLIDK